MLFLQTVIKSISYSSNTILPELMDYVIIHKAVRSEKNLQNQFLVKRLFKTTFWSILPFL